MQAGDHQDYVQATCVVVPAYNEAPIIASVVAELLASFPLVVVVDDGSTDGTAAAARAAGAVVVRHAVNLGQGGALETGLRYGLAQPQVKYFVTFDADGQHDVADAMRMVVVLAEQDLDVVLGSRFLDEASPRSVSPSKRLVLAVATFINNRFSGVRLTDAHNGLRAFRRSFAQLVRFSMLDMAHASEVTMILSRSKLRYCEVPVSIRYTDYSRAKGQRTVNGVNIVFDLLMSKLGGRRS